MQTISSAWQAAMQSGWQIATSLQVLASGAPVNLGGTLRMSTAQVTVSRTNANRRQANLTLTLDTVGQSLIPSSANTGPLTPFGNEIAPQCGWINPATGIAEYVPLGVLALETVVVDDAGTQMGLQVTGFDRSWTMSQRKFLAPYAVTDGTRGDQALSALVTFVLGGSIPQNIVPAFDVAGDPLNVSGTTFNENTDPWAAAQTIAGSIGYEIFFDAVGTFTARPIPDPTTAPVAWSYVQGQGNLMVAVSKSLTRNGISNDFIVTGSGSGIPTPVRGEASVTDPNDPMYISGPFGDVPTFVNSSLVTTDDQAVFAAQNQLAVGKGQVETLTATVALNPALDVDDVIYAYRPRAGVAGFYVIDTAVSTIAPSGTTTLTCRRAR